MRLGVEAALVDGALVPGDVEILGGRVSGVGLASANGHGIAAPGFVDLQVNGFAGIDFLSADAEGYRLAGEALLETGVTAYLPTFITSPEEQLLAALREVPRGGDGPRVLGAHLEGPFLSALRLGIHSADARRNPDVDLLERLLDAGPVRLVTLAPELPGASKVIERLLRREIAVSCGHSDADAEQANRAFDLGVRSVTHLFNAMRPFHHRDPGSLERHWRAPDVVVQLDPGRRARRPRDGRDGLAGGAGGLRSTDAVAGAGLDDGATRLGEPRRRDPRRRRPRADGSARGQHAHDDRRRPQPPLARGAARGRDRSGDGGAGARPPACPRPAASESGCPRISSS